jgi:hypothetical protein
MCEVISSCSWYQVDRVDVAGDVVLGAYWPAAGLPSGGPG